MNLMVTKPLYAYHPVDINNDHISAGSEYGSSDSDVNYEEIESMLDERLPEELKNKKKEYEERFKIIMEGKFLYLIKCQLSLMPR